MSLPVVIVGTGLAGYKPGQEFRKLDSQTPLLLIISQMTPAPTPSPCCPPALAKNKDADELCMAEAGAMAEQLNAEIRTHTRISGIDPAHRQLWLGKEAPDLP